MNNFFCCLILFIFIFHAFSLAEAKVKLSPKNRALLSYHHSVIKKSHVQVKKADMNSLRSELKKENKAKKAARAAGGIE